VIYLDTSVALAHLLAEDRRPPAALWSQPLVSSRLLEYELWTRVHARGLGESHGDMVRQVLGRVSALELIGEVLGRASEPFPVPVRTLDALHLASFHFLQRQGVRLALATYDVRLEAAARALDLPVHPLD
jgi:predicted nucleic acid-binding protein